MEKMVNKEEMTDIQQMHEATVASRLIEMDRLLKHKFSNLWVSVRKAFLDLDSDKDGFIVAEDI